MTEGYGPSDRDRFWLDHESALADSGLTAKAYAAEHSLSRHALYQARKRLRAVGLLPASERRGRSSKRRKAPAPFSKVEVMASHRSALDFRLSLPNGFVLEWSGEALPEAVLTLVERLTLTR